MINNDGTFTCDYCKTSSNDSEDGHGVFLEYRGNHWSCNEIAKLRFELEDAKARAKTAEENWHKNEARIAKLETEKDAYLEFYKANADAWKEYAKHQEYCAVCAENVDDCEIGTALRSVADVSFEDVISL